MAVILGLDPSQKTGWALYDSKAEVSAIRCGVLKIDATEGKFEANAGLLGEALVKHLKSQRDPDTGNVILPDFAAVEQAPRQPAGAFGGKKKPTVIRFMGQEIAAQEGDEEVGGGGGLQSTLSTNQMAAALCAILGAYRIPFVTMTSADWRKRAYGFGKRTGWQRDDWKKHSRQMCRQMRITATNDDMAEACWIAYAAAGHPQFKLMMRDAA